MSRNLRQFRYVPGISTDVVTGTMLPYLTLPEVRSLSTFEGVPSMYQNEIIKRIRSTNDPYDLAFQSNDPNVINDVLVESSLGIQKDRLLYELLNHPDAPELSIAYVLNMFSPSELAHKYLLMTKQDEKGKLAALAARSYSFLNYLLFDIASNELINRTPSLLNEVLKDNANIRDYLRNEIKAKNFMLPETARLFGETNVSDISPIVSGTEFMTFIPIKPSKGNILSYLRRIMTNGVNYYDLYEVDKRLSLYNMR
ncbi:hypothetical protein D3C87_1163780 [compost metagenome]